MKKILFIVALLLLILAIGYYEDQLLPLAIKSDKKAYNLREDGLIVFISLNKSKFKIGDELKLNLVFENKSDKTLHFYFSSAYPSSDLQFINEKGKVCDKFYTVKYELGSSEHDIYKLAPGEKKNFELSARVILSFYPKRGIPTISFFDVNHTILESGKFRVIFNYNADEFVSNLAKRVGIEDMWLGEISSNILEFNVRLPNTDEINRQIEYLKSGNINKKSEAIKFIQANLETRAIPYLIEILEKESQIFNGLVTDAIRITGDKKAIPKLLDIYKKKALTSSTYQDYEEQNRLLNTILALEENNERAWEFLTEVINSNPSNNVRRYAITEFGYRFKDAKAKDFLIGLLNDSDPLIRMEAVYSLVWNYAVLSEELKKKVYRILREVLLKENDSSVRYSIIRSFGEVGDKNDIMLLKEFLTKTTDEREIENIKRAIEDIEFREKQRAF